MRWGSAEVGLGSSRVVDVTPSASGWDSTGGEEEEALVDVMALIATHGDDRVLLLRLGGPALEVS